MARHRASGACRCKLDWFCLPAFAICQVCSVRRTCFRAAKRQRAPSRIAEAAPVVDVSSQYLDAARQNPVVARDQFAQGWPPHVEAVHLPPKDYTRLPGPATTAADRKLCLDQTKNNSEAERAPQREAGRPDHKGWRAATGGGAARAKQPPVVAPAPVWDPRARTGRRGLLQEVSQGVGSARPRRGRAKRLAFHAVDVFSSVR